MTLLLLLSFVSASVSRQNESGRENNKRQSAMAPAVTWIQEMEAWSKLLGAVAQLLWPIAFFILLIVFRADFSSILKRLKKGKLLGQEVELESEFRALENVTTAAAVEVDEKKAIQGAVHAVESSDVAIIRGSVGPATFAATEPKRVKLYTRDAAPGESERSTDEDKRTDVDEAIVRHIASTAPEVAVMYLGKVIEHEFQTLAEELKMPNEGVSGAVLAHQMQDLLPPELIQSYGMFRSLSSRVVRGKVSRAENAPRLLNIGLQLLRALQDIRSIR